MHTQGLKVLVRPAHPELIADIAAHGYSATGRKYGVSDNAVRKWVKAYAATAASSAS